MSLTIKEEAFAHAYIELGDASAAYKKAYSAGKMSAHSVHTEASRLLAKPKIAEKIAALRAEHRERHKVTVDRLIEEYAKLGFANMLDYMTVKKDGSAFCDLSALTRDQAAAIQEVNFETVQSSNPEALAAAGEEPEDGERKTVAVLKGRIKLADKKGALDSMAKHLGMFTERVEHTGKDGGPIETREISDLEFARRLAYLLTETGKANGHGPPS